jgi:DNA mismatch endonuclease (patch repair protein)
MGFRFRLHVKNLPGQPDIVLPKHKKVIFIHGCFWHLHKGCRDGTIPKTQHEKWKAKLERNVERDKAHLRRLRRSGWKAIVVWECEIEKSIGKVEKKISRFLKQ